MTIKLSEISQRMGEGFNALKAEIEAKLNEENAQTPEQRLKNLQAQLDGAKAKAATVKRDLLACQDEADKYGRYAKKAEESGDSAKVRQFTAAMDQIAEKLTPLQAAQQSALDKMAAIAAMMEEVKNPSAPSDEPPADAPTDAPAIEPVAAPVVTPTEAPVAEPVDAPEVAPTEASIEEPTQES